MKEIKLTHNATMFWFCKKKKPKQKVISKDIPHLLALLLPSSHVESLATRNPHTHDLAPNSETSFQDLYIIHTIHRS